MALNKMAYLWMLVPVLLVACTGKTTPGPENAEAPEVLDKVEYVKWVEKHPDLVQKKEIDKVSFSCRFIPLDLLLASKQEVMSETQKKLLETRPDSILFFKVTISPSDENDQSVFSLVNTTRVNESDFFNYMNFNFDKDISIVTGQDTLPCASYIFERSYNMSRDLNFLVGFTGKALSTNNTKTVVISDPFFNCGMLKFAYAGETFRNTPKITEE